VSNHFYLAQGDRLPPLPLTATNGDGTPLDLTSVSTLTFSMVNRVTGEKKVDAGTVTVIDAPNGRAQYSWSATDTDEWGEFAGEFTATFGGGLVVSIPGADFIYVHIRPTAASAPLPPP
jgi:hypothetical protein